MNILFCEYLKSRDPSFSHVHIYEVSRNLTHLGHKLVHINTDNSKNVKKDNKEYQFYSWNKIKNKLCSLSLYDSLKGELIILFSLLSAIRLFLIASMLIMRRKEKFDVIYGRHKLFNSEYLLAMLFNIPFVKEVNGIITDEAKISGSYSGFSLRIIRWIEKCNIGSTDKIIAVTSRIKDVLINDYKVEENKIVLIENGANTNLFRPIERTKARDALNLNPDCNYICFVGNLVQWQGIEYLIYAAPLILEKMPETYFLIVGDGLMKKELRDLCNHSNITLNKLNFVGRVPYEQVPLYINASDICVIPSVRGLNQKIGRSPLKLCEYLACEKPVVASDIDGVSNLLIESKSGICVAPENVHELAEAIIKLIADPELRTGMGKNGRKYVVKNRSWKSVARKVAEVCESAIEKHKIESQRRKVRKS